MSSHANGRRRFLKTTALVGAGGIAGAAGINGASPYLLPEKSQFEENRSFWSAELPSANAPLQRDLEVDVAIIGGGLTGLSSALYVRKNSAATSVALLEAARCGNGASGRNGAMLLTLTEDRYMESSSDFGLNKRIYDLTADNIRRLRGFSAEYGMDAEIDQDGALQVCNTAEQATEARQYCEQARAGGLPVEFWDSQKTAQAIGTRLYPGAYFDPHSGQVHPGKLVRLFKAAAQAEGAQIFEHSPAVHVEEGAQPILTLASGNTVKCKLLILATNAYSSKLGYLRRAASPIFDYVAMTAPLPEGHLAQIGWTRRVPFNDCRTEVFYLGLTRDNRVHIGGGPVDYVFNNGLSEPACASRRFAALRAELSRIYPALANEPFEVTWSGLVDMSLDQTPAVGRVGKRGNILYAIGFSGHGVNLTSVFGRILADLVAQKDAAWEWLPYLNRLPAYTPNEPFRWAGIQLALGFYRWRDSK
jgi:gamma-glutamylputrescine oxidase